MLISATRRQQASSTSLEESERQISMKNTRERAQQLINIQQAKMCTKQNKQIQKEKEIEMKWRNPRKITIFFSRYCWLPQKQKKNRARRRLREPQTCYTNTCFVPWVVISRINRILWFFSSLSLASFSAASREFWAWTLYTRSSMLLACCVIITLCGCGFFLDAMLARL